MMSDRMGYAPPLPNLNLAPNYERSGKIMLTAIIVLFIVVALMVCLHLYARWYLTRSRTRRHELPRTRRRRTQLVFYVDPSNGGQPVESGGLDAAVLKSLPVFVFSGPESLECAVCLSEFEEKETGRTLPKCKHSFHTSCIDMWFHSHSTCPLCRSAVESAAQLIVEPGSSTSSVGASFGGRTKPPAELLIPIRNQSLARSEDESAASPSPMGRMLRMLSREKRAPASPSLDIECGSEATRRPS